MNRWASVAIHYRRTWANRSTLWPRPVIGISWHRHPELIQIEILSMLLEGGFEIGLGDAAFFKDLNRLVVEKVLKRRAVTGHELDDRKPAVIAGHVGCTRAFGAPGIILGPLIISLLLAVLREVRGIAAPVRELR
jgi:hypothetical protein